MPKSGAQEIAHILLGYCPTEEDQGYLLNPSNDLYHMGGYEKGIAL